MSQPLEQKTKITAEDITITPSEPVRNENDVIAFSASLPDHGEGSVGFVEGKIKESDGERLGILGYISVDPEWRGLNISSAMFLHFVGELKKQGVDAIETDAVNERTAHLMGTIPGAKSFNTRRDGYDPEEYAYYGPDATAGLLRVMRGHTDPDDPDGSSEIKTQPYRIKAKLN